MNNFEVIKWPIITEKSTRCQEAANQYFFAVVPQATKNDIQRAVEKLFNVHVVAVRTMQVAGKGKRVGKTVGRTASWKKAMVKLKTGERIEFLEGA